MTATTSPARPQGTDVVELIAPDGAAAAISLHGGHLLSWKPAGAAEQLYLSPRSEFAPGKAIRGGVPVIFPQFSDRGTLPRHGFARTLPWELVSSEQGKGDALAVLRLRDSDATRAIWPHAFELELSVRIGGRELDIELACENTGETRFQFTTALHTYLRVADLDAVSVEGLSGLRYFDSVKQAEALQRMDLLLTGEKGVLDLDRIYFGVKERPLLLAEDRRQVVIRQLGFEDAVLWNPGPERCAKLADMPPEGWSEMLCVEAASIGRPIELQAGESWVGRQSLALL
ncbi:D-hexose-6-phosphate mutarotase [Roseateles saccharophilus]|uniref:Putative glucose-6-phosphate 1-epimerase n=1 Tax=Roseateles saccharophilus TaxID=304 RepID=A0A4V6P2N3_ROSSA|nr:D-hexose-6-phosphate mutarotase [Roseateles saccharophilus]MDG0835363.1 D-hexose-6-phosphate mutarotase [Roseateles saccharophilus]TCU96169.1 glucose-6-phosphate 1-epimerase [Roseateles saccharophilus]